MKQQGNKLVDDLSPSWESEEFLPRGLARTYSWDKLVVEAGVNVAAISAVGLSRQRGKQRGDRAKRLSEGMAIEWQDLGGNELAIAVIALSFRLPFEGWC